jgi:hypothetical protein
MPKEQGMGMGAFFAQHEETDDGRAGHQDGDDESP